MPPAPGLESPAETSARVEALAQDVLGDAEASTEGTTVLFVTHSKVLEAVLAKVFGNVDGRGKNFGTGGYEGWVIDDLSKEV